MTEISTQPRKDDAPTRAGLRVVFLITVAPEDQDRFLDAYDQIRFRVAERPGHLCDQVGRSTDDPTRWVITSEWATRHDFESWERSAEHRELVAPMRALLSAPVSLRFEVHRETR
ncbi:antibiotic biosynthesis monooxygenase family protein [Nocardiopsis alba]|uniref:Antibiotic biosynthesis monooxygenase n=1 Tax=Nocardiopsis alba TaxID=53437 RepID=A0A7K2IPB1_9ACTN|nr:MULTISPECIES: antibiotic biosynthesis monooxygenase family protein [Nocardiopsis]MEC3894052.1 antibiotic biosynthesis monooxygenase family protein [Nocardiopsis sp. LDBS1602]MYR31667.1 antibiotic biosynthesis monooxygenase [Nocardiopsis alba]